MANNKRRPLSGQGADIFFGGTEEAKNLETSTSLSQDTSKEVNQQASEEVDQDTSKEALKKVSYYIRRDQDIKLERIKLQRKEIGIEIDKSALIREAIDKLLEE